MRSRSGAYSSLGWVLLALAASGCSSPDFDAAFGLPEELVVDAMGVSRVGPLAGPDAALAVGADAKLVCTNGFLRRPSPVWLWEEGGPWTPVDVEGAPPSAGCAVAVVGDALHVAYATVAGVVVATSTDGAASWTLTSPPSSMPGVPSPAPGVPQRPWLAGDAERLVVTFETASPQFRVHLSASEDGGRTWAEPVVVAEGAPLTEAGTAGEPVLTGGRVLIPVHRFPLDASGEPRLDVVAWDEDEAHTLGIPLEGRPVPRFVPTLAGAGDTLHAAYPVANGTGVDVLASRSLDGGRTWAEPVRVFEGVTSGEPPALALEERGSRVVTVALQHQRENGTRSEWVVTMARVLSGAVGESRLVSHPARPPGGAATLVSVRHDATGAALVAFPVREDGCGAAGEPGADYCIDVLEEVRAAS